jgi:hypothetical protein
VKNVKDKAVEGYQFLLGKFFGGSTSNNNPVVEDKKQDDVHKNDLNDKDGDKKKDD